MSTNFSGAVKGIFNMYSPRLGPRLIVLLTMGLGTWLLIDGVGTGSAVGALPFLILVWANAERFLGTIEVLLDHRTWLIFVVPLVVFASRLVMFPPTAVDDLLRHIASAFWPGGYADMYVHATVPKVEMYPLFDTVVGGLAKLIGLRPAMWVVQGVALSGFVCVFILVGMRLLGGVPMASSIVLIALVWVLAIMSLRLFLARPEIFLAIWAIAAPLASGRWRGAVWIATGVLLGLSYWLAPIYFTAAYLMPKRALVRISTFVGLGSIWFVTWLGMTEGQLLTELVSALSQVGNRIEGISVSENTSIVNVLVAPLMIVLVFGALWSFGRPGVDNRFLIVAVFFMLSNQARYASAVAPLLVFYILTALRFCPLQWPRYSRLAILVVSVFWLSLIADLSPKYYAQPRFKLPQGAIVLSYLSEASYFIPFENPGAVKIAPVPEIGAASPIIQEISKGLIWGRLDCEKLKGLGFSHVVENTLVGSSPPCLALSDIHGQWRLWKIN